jgi:glycosyltransferase involved in cell wall biosynthesis
LKTQRMRTEAAPRRSDQNETRRRRGRATTMQRQPAAQFDLNYSSTDPPQRRDDFDRKHYIWTVPCSGLLANGRGCGPPPIQIMRNVQPADPQKAKRLRLLHVAPVPPPWSGIGVSFQHFIQSAPISAQCNLVIDSASRDRGTGRTKLPTPRRIARHIRLTARIIRAAREHHAQVVHLHGSSHDLSFLANGLSIIGAGRFGAHTVWHLHEDLSVVQFPGRSVVTQRAFACMMRAPGMLAVLTEHDRTIANRYVDTAKLDVIPPTCSPTMLPTPLGRATGDVNALFVGWLTPAKGIFDLLEVALRVRELKANVRFNVLGVGRTHEQTRAVQGFIDQHGLQSVVRLHGLVTGSEKDRIFAESHILFTASHWDAFPVTVLEAMSAGLPVLATRVGGIPHMVEEERGAFLTPVGDVAAMAERLVDLAKHPQRRLAMGAANRERYLDLYHPDRVGQRALEMYERLICARA